jgi:hypothetical protein
MAAYQVDTNVLDDVSPGDFRAYRSPEGQRAAEGHCYVWLQPRAACDPRRRRRRLI